MRKLDKIIYFSLAAGMGLAMALSVQAADLVYSTATNISIGSHTYVIAVGSTATTLSTATDSLTVTVPSGGIFTLSSADSYLLNNNQGIPQTCTSAGNQIVANGPVTVTVTPDAGSTCTIPTGSGNQPVSPGGGSTYTPPASPPAASAAPAAPSTPVTPTTLPTTQLQVPAATAAPAGAHENGTLVNDNGTIYLIQNGQRYAFRDSAEYKSNGYSFSQAVAANSVDQSLALASANIVKAMPGTLVLDSSDNKTVYMIGAGNTKRGFASAIVFKALGYSFSNLPKINLSDYPAGPAVTVATDPHPDGSLVLDGKTIWWINNGQKSGFESMAVFSTYGFSLSRVVKANAADLALPQGPLIKFRDGTLVNDGGTYFLISDGKKLAFASAADVTAKGYKTSNVIKASLANYESGGSVQ